MLIIVVKVFSIFMAYFWV